MTPRQVDIAIIGAGTAGLNAVSEARKSGRSWVVIDSGPYGTTCARVGCMPSKLLVQAADAAHAARRCGEFGIRTGPVEVDGPAVMRRVRRVRDRFVAGVVDDIQSLPEDNRLCGRARFVDATTLEVDGADGPLTIVTRATVIATGSAPLVPPVFDPVRDRLLTSDSVFELTRLPRTMAVVGTGIIGLELGQALSRLGVRITLFDRSQHVGPCTDPEVVRCVDAVISAELSLHLGADIGSAEPHGDGVALVWRQAGAERSAVFDAVLVAAGRRADLAPLNLAATGLELDEHGQPNFDPGTTQCGDRPIFLAGDANGHRPLLHEGGDEGRIGGENAARWPDVQAHERRTPLTVIFSDPQIALVGATHRELHEPGRSPVAIGAASFANQGRARVMARNQGIVRVYAGRDDCRLLGAELFGPRMEHMAHLLAWAVQQGTTVQQLLAMPVYHPTLEEGLRSALRDLARDLKIEAACRAEDLSESPGM
jgi:dihydrolipoamide dehydrogenase